MNIKHLKGWLKHGDFILLDMICLQVCFVLAYWLFRGFGNPYRNRAYYYQVVLLTVGQMFVILFSGKYEGILRRKRFDEALAVFYYTVKILLVALLYLFAVQDTSTASRLQFGFTLVFYLILDYGVRQLNKRRVLKKLASEKHVRSIILITGVDNVRDALERMQGRDALQDFILSGIVLMDARTVPEEIRALCGDIPVIGLTEEALERIGHHWVDEVLILQPDRLPFPNRLMETLMSMGLTVHFTMAALNDQRWPLTDIQKIGGYKVLTSSVRFVSAEKMLVKRMFDIVGGIVGCIITGILWIFIAPAIYIKSPGPIFFTQERVGQNGRIFRMYNIFIEAAA